MAISDNYRGSNPSKRRWPWQIVCTGSAWATRLA